MYHFIIGDTFEHRLYQYSMGLDWVCYAYVLLFGYVFLNFIIYINNVKNFCFLFFFFGFLGKPIYGIYCLMRWRMQAFLINIWKFYHRVRKKMFSVCVEISSKEEPCLPVHWFALPLQDVGPFLLNTFIIRCSC